ncbi:polysaccharide pyruvyl transferase family protein [Sinorhizobium numidicum]|uniref:Polysaccharide pyruvyl transferase family protein n=1 Tax=Sinorhizobium numidicum TaxID=680248 RepID=A0ABY8D191_9HYPH|nr:polysaccharide pyruvyl transferase family protein [Sinorhizobium numidicum]WEX77482.1 polysaccharide pyruvyl transferase family protein [Sinorhizobium numidicum]WEX84142.1 polysaccharide pyruvyl transferase family protein [Sinorhizobium numidicum]
MHQLGVLTFHQCINYGSFWQTRCLVDGLRAYGADPVILNHHSDRIRRAEWRCALQPLLPVGTKREDFPLYASKIRKFVEAFASLPLTPPFALDNPADLEDFDLVIVGSDEVWNLRHPWYGGYPLFYGEGLAARRLASYAATFGSYPASKGLESYWADSLRKFDDISVRDENSRSIIKDALGLEPTLVLDPCLQFPETIPRSQDDSCVSSYLAVYGHSFPYWFQQAVRRSAASHSVSVVSIGYRNDWADAQWIDAGPDDFARFIAGARAIATNFFHGCVFSLVNTKPFVCVLSDYRCHKIHDLAQMVRAERHVVSEETPQADYDALLGGAPDPVTADQLASLRLRSRTYLNNVLN